MNLYIHNYIHWKNNQYWFNGEKKTELAGNNTVEFLADLYREKALNYPKFFKMDILSKCAYLCSELVVPQPVTEAKENIATLIYSEYGCLDVDKKFDTSIASIASPALFVYTLPNIMLGEICIRHGFKGEQFCSIAEQPNLLVLETMVKNLAAEQQTDALLIGQIDAIDSFIRATMFWVSTTPSNHVFNQANLNTLFSLLQQS